MVGLDYFLISLAVAAMDETLEGSCDRDHQLGQADVLHLLDEVLGQQGDCLLQNVLFDLNRLQICTAEHHPTREFRGIQTPVVLMALSTEELEVVVAQSSEDMLTDREVRGIRLARVQTKTESHYLNLEVEVLEPVGDSEQVK